MVTASYNNPATIMNLEDYQQIDAPTQVLSKVPLMVGKIDDDGNVVQRYEVLLVRDNTIVVRAIGPRRSTTLEKVALPRAWDPRGHEADGVKYKLFLKKGEVAVAPKEKSGKRGPKREGPSKLDACRKIWDDNPNLTRADMRKKFIDEGQCTEMGANTYYLKIKAEKEAT